MANTVNISFQKQLLSDIDKLAKEEDRSRSELIREAARMYIERKNKWKQIFSLMSKHVKKTGLKESDVSGEIRSYRKKQTK